jgi:hypothetical protein
MPVDGGTTAGPPARKVKDFMTGRGNETSR